MAGTPNKNKELVLATFDTLAKAEEAQQALHVWDKATDSIKLGGTAVLYKDADSGKIKYKRSGSRDWLVGGAFGLLVMALGGGIIFPIAGAAVGVFVARHHRVEGNAADIVQAELAKGRAAVAVMCDDFERDDVKAELTRLGGQAVHISVPAEVVADAQQSVQKAADDGNLPEELATTPTTTTPSDASDTPPSPNA